MTTDMSRLEALTDDQADEHRSSFTATLIGEISEIPDRNSPEDEPDALIANADEITNCIANALDRMDFVVVPRSLLAARHVEQQEAAPGGYCERAGGCVCGGDLPRVREGCSEWVKSKAAPALADDLPREQMSAIEKLGGAIESALDQAPVSDVLSVLTGAFVGLAVELVRRQGHDVAREIKVNGGPQRDITIHAPKEPSDVDVLKT